MLLLLLLFIIIIAIIINIIVMLINITFTAILEKSIGGGGEFQAWSTPIHYVAVSEAYIEPSQHLMGAIFDIT